jgi:hypothetical protein
MFGNEIKKQKELIDKIKCIWENEHAEEISKAYNNIVAILATLDMYNANMLVNLLWLQTAQKSYVATVGKKEVEVK